MATAMLPNCSPFFNPCQPSISASSYRPPPSPAPAYLETPSCSSKFIPMETSSTPPVPPGTEFGHSIARGEFPEASLSRLQLSGTPPASTSMPTHSATPTHGEPPALTHSLLRPHSQWIKCRCRCSCSSPCRSSGMLRPRSPTCRFGNYRMAHSCCALNSPRCTCSRSASPMRCVCSRPTYPTRPFWNTCHQIGDETQHWEYPNPTNFTKSCLSMTDDLKNSLENVSASSNNVSNSLEYMPQIDYENRQKNNNPLKACPEDLELNRSSIQDSRTHFDHPVAKKSDYDNLPCTYYGETCLMNALPSSYVKPLKYPNEQTADSETNRGRITSAFETRGENLMQNRYSIKNDLTHFSEDHFCPPNNGANRLSTCSLERNAVNTDQKENVPPNHSTNPPWRGSRQKCSRVNGSKSSGLPVTSSTTNVQHITNPVEEHNKQFLQSTCEPLNCSTASKNTCSLAKYFADLMANTNSQGNTTEKNTRPVHAGNVALHIHQNTYVPPQCQENRLQTCRSSSCPLHSANSMFRDIICPNQHEGDVLPEFKSLTLHMECTCPKPDCSVHAKQWARLTMEKPKLPGQDTCHRTQGVETGSSHSTFDFSATQHLSNADRSQTNTSSGSTANDVTGAREETTAGVGVGPEERLRSEVGARNLVRARAGVVTETGHQFGPGVGTGKEVRTSTGARGEMSPVQELPTRPLTCTLPSQGVRDDSALSCPVHRFLAQLFPLCTCQSSSQELRPGAVSSSNPSLPDPLPNRLPPPASPLLKNKEFTSATPVFKLRGGNLYSEADCHRKNGLQESFCETRGA